MILTKENKQRFWEKVQKTDTCWIWIGCTTNKKWNYGNVRVNKQYLRAHRLSWIIHYGEIPPNLFVCHKCDNPQCVRPDHLFLGTAKDNTQDALAKNRLNTPRGLRHKTKTHPELTLRGEKSNSVKLTNQQVLEIRSKYHKIYNNSHKLGKEYQVDESTIRAIIIGKTWKHLL